MGRKRKECVVPNNKNHYVNNKDFYEELIKCKENDELSDELVRMFLLMCERLSRKMTYQNPQDREDCIQTACLSFCRYWRSFNPEITKNAFSYFTSLSSMGMAKGWNDLQKGKPNDALAVPSETIYSI